MVKFTNIFTAFAKAILLTFGFVIATILVTKLFSILAPVILTRPFTETYKMTDIAATTIRTTYPQIIVLIRLMTESKPIQINHKTLF